MGAQVGALPCAACLPVPNPACLHPARFRLLPHFLQPFPYPQGFPILLWPARMARANQPAPSSLQLEQERFGERMENKRFGERSRSLGTLPTRPCCR